MELLRKMILNDGEIMQMPLDTVTKEEDPRRLGRGTDRIEIINREKQTILGFGGAFTESAALNYAALTPEEKQKAMEYLFGETGLHYNFCRVCIGASDFARSSYHHVADGDAELVTFNIDRDREAVIPMIRDAQAYSKQPLFLLASPWTPPAWMKEGRLPNKGRLLPQYYRVWARYFCRFIEEYEKEGVLISAVTPQNEPGSHRWEGCEFTQEELAAFIAVLAEELDRYPRRIEILCWDYNRGGMFEHADRIYETLGERVWGAAFHWYNGVHEGELQALHDAWPRKVLVESEFCHGLSARMYGKYRTEILDVLNNWTNAVCEWNLLLDTEGGPYHNRDIGCNSPLYRDGEQVFCRGVYHQMYMFSHYIQPGACALFSSSAYRSVRTLAVRNPDGEVLFYAYNDSLRDENCTIAWNEYRIPVSVPRGALLLWIMKE
ncbi:MAG: hypothetical protein J5889_01565 [Clostridia bacterium]|nr:hypothetical protein [Clostridia bacterium]